MAAAEPVGHERSAEPWRLADDGGGARLFGHAAVADVPARRVDGLAGCGARGAVRCGDESRAEAESVGLALLVVLDTLAPAERLAFVLHDMFSVSFDEIAGIVGRSPEAARQLASRARRRVRGAEMAADADRESHRRIVETFVTALRGGDFNALIALLDPDLVASADTGPSGAPREVHGAEQWAKGAIAYVQAVGFAQPALALVDGAVGLVLAPRGKLSRALKFTIKDGKISQIEVITEQSRLKQLNLAILTG
jgi:hypothetical protein